MTAQDVARFQRCVAAGGVALFPADTVYGLAANPDSEEGVERLHRIKGHHAQRPSAVMFFDLASALATLDELGQRTRGALERVLPGSVTVVVPNPARRFPLACGPTTPERLGLRVPALKSALAPLSEVRWPVLQSSANRTGEPDARKLEEVDSRIRTAVDLVLDGGPLPGIRSTVVDLTAYEADGTYAVLRAGAMTPAQLATALGNRTSRRRRSDP